MPSLSDLEYGLYEAMQENTAHGTGSLTAPIAGAGIASLNVDPGYWEFTVLGRLGLGGAPAAGDQDNMRFRDNTGGVNILTLPVIAATNGSPVPVTVRFKVTVTSTMVIQAVSAGTASVTYQGYINARKVADV